MCNNSTGQNGMTNETQNRVKVCIQGRHFNLGVNNKCCFRQDVWEIPEIWNVNRRDKRRLVSDTACFTAEINVTCESALKHGIYKATNHQCFSTCQWSQLQKFNTHAHGKQTVGCLIVCLLWLMDSVMHWFYAKIQIYALLYTTEFQKDSFLI